MSSTQPRGGGLKKIFKVEPELITLGAAVTGILGVAAYFFSRKNIQGKEPNIGKKKTDEHTKINPNSFFDSQNVKTGDNIEGSATNATLIKHQLTSEQVKEFEKAAKNK